MSKFNLDKELEEYGLSMIEKAIITSCISQEEKKPSSKKSLEEYINKIMKQSREVK